MLLKQAAVSSNDWNELFLAVASYLNGILKWKLHITVNQNVIHYYIATSEPLPISLGLTNFLLKPAEDLDFSELEKASLHGFYSNKPNDNFVTLLQRFKKRGQALTHATLTFYSVKSLWFGQTRVYYEDKGHQFTKQLVLFAPSVFVAIDFDKAKTFLFQKFPKYLKLEKVTKLLTSHASSALFKIDAFPYLEQTEYLKHSSYDFSKHSLVIGASGSGKSRFLVSLLHQIYQNAPEDYRVVVIDPHDALYQDCAEIDSRQVVNFQTLADSINLFEADADNINASVELLLTLFKSLINDSYNGRLERVLRYASYLLLSAEKFSFLTLRKLLLDLEYRNQLVSAEEDRVPTSVSHFFLTDFNELRTQNYNDAIAPIIAFIDEMQMVPVFNSEKQLESLAEVARENFLSLFSLNRLKLGDKVSRTIAGLLMQQLFLFAQKPTSKHLIIVIDEVAVVENPIIARFLSELRKYNASVILAGQYFDQISADLRAAIFANVTNYYLFRTSEHDAEILTQNLKIKVEGSKEPEDAKKLLTRLKFRECLVQISQNGEILPIFKARTTDYNPPALPDKAEQILDVAFDFSIAKPRQNILDQDFAFGANGDEEAETSSYFSFEIGDADATEFIKNYSTSRKLKGETHVKTRSH